MRSVFRCVIVSLVALLFALPTHAQNTDSSMAPQWQLGAGYASAGGPTSNGQFYFIGKQLGNRVFGLAKVFTLANPSGVVVVTASPRYTLPLSAFWKQNSYLDTSKFVLNFDANLGVSKDALGTSRFAYGVGAGLDYKIATNVTIMAVEVDYLRSKMFPTGSLLITVNNLNAISTGIKFNF
jgi:hypothetical protein